MSPKGENINLESEFDYYLNNQEDFARQYEGKVFVIKGQKIIGIYESKTEALTETIKKHKLGTFLIQLCSTDPKSTACTVHSRVRMLNATI